MSSEQIGFLVSGIAGAILVALVIYTIVKSVKKGRIFTPQFIAKTGIFAAISIILYTVPFLKFGLPIFPSFLEFHFDEVPALIAGLAYGPISGSIVVLIKTLVKLPFTNTAMVGEMADFIYSIAFVIPAALIYEKHKSLKGALASLSIATVIQVVVATIFTTYVMLGFYSALYKIPMEVILDMCSKVTNGACKDLNFGYMFFISIPFNGIKDITVVIVTMILYKRLHGLIDKIG